VTASRLLEHSPSVLFIVYTPGEGAQAKGYEPWLVNVDNPFFNAIPGVLHYANWKIERVLSGAPLPYGYFDFQGLVADADLERVWFNPDLDKFRTEWVRLWGYGLTQPPPIQTNAYLMRPTKRSAGKPSRYARVTGGLGTPPEATDLAWRMEETIRKHFSIGPSDGPWRIPSAQDNPLGLDWIGVTYGKDVETLAEDHVPSDGETVAFVARLLAAPE
jgi:hypothetical protein